MGSDDQSGAKPAGPVVLRIKLRYDDVETLVLKFASNVGKSGLFLPTKSLQPIGTEVKFELRLSNDTPVLVGLGRVKAVKAFDAANPKAAFGMAIELMRVSREGREVIIKMLERRRALGLPEVAIPVPEDVDAAKRIDSGSQPRDTSGIVRDAMRDFASAPVAEQVLAAQPSGPLAVAKPEPVPPPAPAPVVVSARDSGSLLTSPRAGSGPIPVVTADAASRSVPVLAPEPARTKRPRASDLLARANELAGRLANVDVPGLDANVDVERALVRARALAGSDLDGELAALLDSAAAPNEISIEAASAELARQLGGVAINKRDRSKAVKTPPVATPIAVDVRAESSAATQVPVVEAPVPAPAPAPELAVAPVAEPAIAAEPEPVAAIEVVPPEPEPAVAIEAVPPEPEPAPDDEDDGFAVNASTTTAIDPAQIQPYTDEASLRRALEGSSPGIALDESDMEPVDDEEHGEATHIGSFPVDPRTFNNADELADRLDRQLDDAEAEADEDLRELQGNAPAPQAYAIQPYATEYEEPGSGAGPEEAVAGGEEVSDLDVLAEADASDADLLHASAEREEAARVDEVANYEGEPGYAEPPAYAEQPAFAEQTQFAEAYAEPAYAEQAPYSEQPAYAEPAPYVEHSLDQPLDADPNAGYGGYGEPVRPSQEDFAARLDFGDEDEEERRNFPTANPRPRSRTGSVAPAMREDDGFPDPPSSSYTFAEPFPQAAPQFAAHAIGEDFDEPHGFTQNTPAPASPRTQHAPSFEQPATRPRSPSRAPVDAHVDPLDRALAMFDEPSHPTAAPVPSEPHSEDLEDALSALAVDLDPETQKPRRSRPTGLTATARPLPGMPVHRPGETGQVPVTPAAPPARRTTGANVIARGDRPGKGAPTAPPPIPTAARRSGTMPPPTPVPVPPKRATTDDGIEIDFDDD